MVVNIESDRLCDEEFKSSLEKLRANFTNNMKQCFEEIKPEVNSDNILQKFLGPVSVSFYAYHIFIAYARCPRLFIPVKPAWKCVLPTDGRTTVVARLYKQNKWATKKIFCPNKRTKNGICIVYPRGKEGFLCLGMIAVRDEASKHKPKASS